MVRAAAELTTMHERIHSANILLASYEANSWDILRLRLQ